MRDKISVTFQSTKKKFFLVDCLCEKNAECWKIDILLLVSLGNGDSLDWTPSKDTVGTPGYFRDTYVCTILSVLNA